MKLKGQTWEFQAKPRILASATVVGPEEGQGPLASDFDYIYDNLEINEKTWEKAERKLLEQASQLAVVKAGLTKEQIQFFIGGDLMNQIISSTFAARTLGAPYLGVFGAAPPRWKVWRLRRCSSIPGLPNGCWPERQAITARRRNSSATPRNTGRKNRPPRNIP